MNKTYLLLFFGIASMLTSCSIIDLDDNYGSGGYSAGGYREGGHAVSGNIRRVSSQSYSGGHEAGGFDQYRGSSREGGGQVD